MRAPNRERINRQHVGAECFLIKKNAGNEPCRAVDLSSDVLRKAGNIDSELLNQPLGDRTVRRWALDRERSTIAEQLAVADRKLVALRMSSEIIVVLDNQDSRVGIRLAKEICGR